MTLEPNLPRARRPSTCVSVADPPFLGPFETVLASGSGSGYETPLGDLEENGLHYFPASPLSAPPAPLKGGSGNPFLSPAASSSLGGLPHPHPHPGEVRRAQTEEFGRAAAVRSRPRPRSMAAALLGGGLTPSLETEGSAADGGDGDGVDGPAEVVVSAEDGRKRRRKVGLRDRVGCFQWTWFTMTMATGGIANVLHSIPYTSQWLSGVGLAFFFLNICLFIMNCVLLSLRFHWRPGSFVESFTDQLESLFISAIVVSIATILITITQYGIPRTGPWLLSVVEALFWIYTGVSVLVSASLYLTLWSTQAFPIHTMTPVWVFPAYPLLLAAPFGGNLINAAATAGRLVSINSIPVAFAALAVQGTGFLISFMISSAFLYRLMTQKLPRDHQRPGVFISIGPGGFTCAGIVQLGMLTSSIFPSSISTNNNPIPTITTTYHDAATVVPIILQLQAYTIGLVLWGLSLWFFLVSVGSLWKYVPWPGRRDRSHLRFQMTWFSFVFPNTALVTATEALGVAFGSTGLKIFGCVLAACLVVVWLLVFTKMLWCLWRRELLWPKEEED